MVAGVLNFQDIDELFASLKSCQHLALAVSGGGDSMAMMVLAQHWARQVAEPPTLTVLTIDHRLRKDSSAEAEWVAQQAGALGLPHHILVWEQAPPAASQAEAREARYNLMCGFALAHGIGAILTAHTSDDVAETFLMRLARGSGVDGLSAISPETRWDGVTIIRPFLDISRAQLRAELNARGAAWIEDPSNADERYERVRVRGALDTLAGLGVTRARIVESANRLRRTRDAIDAVARDFIATDVEITAAGYVRLSPSALHAVPDELAIHALKTLLRAVGGQVRSPRLRKLELLARQMRRGPRMRTTLGGCVISLDAARKTLIICREPGRLQAEPVMLSSGESAIWDRRFRIEAGALPAEPIRVDALGEGNVSRLPDALRKAHPAAALAALPAIYSDDRLLGVPVPGFELAEQLLEANDCRAAFIWDGANSENA